MRCRQCDAEVRETDRFCDSCGAALVPPPAAMPEARTACRCPRCGQRLDAVDRFCGYCGAPAANVEEAPPVAGATRLAVRTPPHTPLHAPPDTSPRTPNATPLTLPETTRWAGRPHRTAIALAYLNLFVSLAFIASAHVLMRGSSFPIESARFEDYYPFTITRNALLTLLVGMVVFGVYLWTRKDRRARRHAAIIIVMSLVGVVAGVMVFA